MFYQKAKIITLYNENDGVDKTNKQLPFVRVLLYRGVEDFRDDIIVTTLGYEDFLIRDVVEWNQSRSSNQIPNIIKNAITRKADLDKTFYGLDGIDVK